MTDHGHHFLAPFGLSPLCDTSSNEGQFFFLCQIWATPAAGYATLISHCSFFLNVYSMSITANTTYTAYFPKRPNITGAPDQVLKFNNFLDCLIGGIKANTISAIGTINSGSVCTQFFYAPQIHFNLASDPIAFIGNLSKKWVSSV
jgi:hypothetical protein